MYYAPVPLWLNSATGRRRWMPRRDIFFSAKKRPIFQSMFLVFHIAEECVQIALSFSPLVGYTQFTPARLALNSGGKDRKKNSIVFALPKFLGTMTVQNNP